MKSKWLVLLLIWLMMLVAYFDRIDMAVAGPSIMAGLGFTKVQFGFALSAFTLGYAIMQAPGGHLADRLGSRPLLITAIIVWSVFTGLTGMAASLAMMIGIRIIFGVGEGLENGAQFKLVGDRFSEKERSLASAIFLSALALGPAIGTPISTWMIGSYGWRNMFFAFSGCGVVVGLILVAFLPHHAPQSPLPSPIGLVMGEGGSTKRTEGSDVEGGEGVAQRHLAPSGFKEALRLPSTWLCAGSYMLFNVAFWGFLSWVPTYLKEERHIALAKIGLAGSLPYFAGFLGMVIAGRLGSTILSNRRPALVATCYAAAAAGLIFALTARDATSCVAGLSVAGFFLYGGFGPFWAIAIDLAPVSARGVFTGSVNCCGQIGAFSSQIIIGALADRMKSFSGAILFMVGALIIGAVAIVALPTTNSRPEHL